MERRKRLEDGTMGPLEPIGKAVPIAQQLATLGMQLAQEKLAGIQKDTAIKGLGAQLVQMKLEIIQLKGGN